MAEDGIQGLDPGPEAPADDLRSDIAEAFEQVESRTSDAGPAPGSAPAPAASPGATPAASPGGRSRGPDGKYLPSEAPQKAAGAPGEPGRAQTPKPTAPAPGKPPGPAAAAPAPGADPAAPAPAPAPIPAKAPQSWKPQAREHWAKLPPDVQQEVIRREAEVGRVLKESSNAREALGQVQNVLAPYTHNIRASGTDVLGAIGNFFRADNTLRHGSNADKAQTVADIIKSYGVDIVTLDSVLAGQQVAPDPLESHTRKLRQEVQQQLQPVMSMFQQMQGYRQQALGDIQTKAGSQVEQFGADEAHEFFEDVRNDMADIIDLYTARGQSISLQDAYDRAIMLNPSVREIVNAREEAARVNTQAAAAQRARRAAASVGGSPAPAGSPGPASDDRRSAISAAWDQTAGS